MDLTSLLATTGQGQVGGATKSKSNLTQQDFMNLFVTQVRNQNPLDPMDNYQMATQLAQFHSAESLQQMAASIKNLELYQASLNNLQLPGLIGRKVQSSTNTIEKHLGAVSEAHYQLPRTGKVTIRVFDSNWNLIKSIEAGIKDTSEQRFVWDGKDQKGVPVPDGKYTFDVLAVDPLGQPIQVRSYALGTVTGISFKDGVPYLHVGSGKITLSDILAIL